MIPCRDPHDFSQYFLEVLRGPARIDILSRQRELLELEVANAHPPRGSIVSNGAAVATKIDPPTEQSHSVPGPKPDAASKVADTPRAPLYVENAEGFGQWEVFVTDPANADLRKLRKDSKDVFLMAIKKIRCAF